MRLASSILDELYCVIQRALQFIDLVLIVAFGCLCVTGCDPDHRGLRIGWRGNASEIVVEMVSEQFGDVDVGREKGRVKRKLKA